MAGKHMWFKLMGFERKPVNGDDGDNTIDLSDRGHGARMNGGDGNDFLVGTAFRDRINAGDGDDTVTGGEGNDRLFGNGGTDTAVYAGSVLDFSWAEQWGHRLIVTDQNAGDGDEGTDMLKHFEVLQFGDYSFDLSGNNAPMVRLGDQGTDEETAFDFSFDAYDFDGGTLTVDSLSVTGGGAVTLVPGSTALSPGTGTGAQFTAHFDPGAAYQHLAEGESATETVEVVVSDGQGGSTTRTADIVIDGVNDAPTANDDSGVVGEDGPGIVIDLLGNDTDPDGSDVLAVDSFDFSGLQGSVTDNGDGTVTYDPDGAFEDLDSGETALDSFTYTVGDGHGGADTATVNVTVEGADDTPTVSVVVADFDGVAERFPRDYLGLNWSPRWNALPGDDHGTNSGYYNGLVSGDQIAFNGGGLSVEITGNDFDFESGYFTAAWRDGLSLRVSAFDDGAQVGQELFVLDTSGPSFIEFDDAIFDSVDRVLFETFGGTVAGLGGTGTQFAADDLSFYL
ncbi:MAG: Ig-like domain-containing protein [Paracoccaceae bacterium]